MDHFEFRYTVGMDEAEVADYLRDGRVAVLSLADDGRAYAVPVGYHYDGESLLVRLLDDDDAEKADYLDGTREACLLLYGVDGDASWSIQARGSPRELVGDERAAFDDERINEAFGPVRVFGEPTADLSFSLYELDDAVVTGRRTPGA
jgi:hypothetical protein